MMGIADSWWIRDWGWRIGTSSLASPPDGAPLDTWNNGQLISGMQIACEDSCHNQDFGADWRTDQSVIQLPYYYGCLNAPGAAANLTLPEGQGYEYFASAAFVDGHTSFHVECVPVTEGHAEGSGLAVKICIITYEG